MNVNFNFSDFNFFGLLSTFLKIGGIIGTFVHIFVIILMFRQIKLAHDAIYTDMFKYLLIFGLLHVIILCLILVLLIAL